MKKIKDVDSASAPTEVGAQTVPEVKPSSSMAVEHLIGKWQPQYLPGKFTTVVIVVKVMVVVVQRK